MAKEMLVTEGLNELKTLDARIEREISDAKFIVDAKDFDKKVTPAQSKEDFKKKAQGSYDSIMDLIRRRETIKAAIVASNAVTEVEICGEKMTVAKAIETKTSIAYKKNLLYTMKRQLADAVLSMNKKNAALEDKITKLVETSYGKDAKVSPEDYNSIADPMRKSNEVSLVNPLDLETKIEELEAYIEEFTATVDAKLQISNCTTKIVID